MADLSRVSIGIKTFLRNQKLLNAVSGILDTMPEVQIVIADDGYMDDAKQKLYQDLIQRGDRILIGPFDSGFGAKSNRIAGAFDRDYLLVGSDDFDFRPPSVRFGIEKLLDVLDNTDVDVASGRVRGPYEFDLEDRGDVIIEHPVQIPANPTPWYVDCDLTVNYSLIKRRVFEKIRWDDETRIGGGEHGSNFLDIKRAGFKVAYVPGVRISEQSGDDSAEYRKYRSRASSPQRPCFDKRNIRKYVLGNGRVDYISSDYKEPLTR